MATTNFSNGTVILPAWLNDVDAVVYDATVSIPWTSVTWSGSNVTHSGNHTWSGNMTFNGNTVIGNAAGDTLTVAPSAVTWSNNPTHSGNHTFSGALALSSGAITTATYTPTVVNGVNVAASTPYNTTSYIRIGNMAIISGYIDIDVTAASTLTGLTLSLPFTTTTSSFRQGSGFVLRTNASSLPTIVGSITMDPTNEVMSISFTSDTDVTNRGFQFMFFATNIT